MKFIRQGATHKVVIGPAVAVGDGFTPVTTLSLASADEAEAILHDNGTVVDISGYTFAAITTADGYYHLTLQSGISGTVGHLTIVIHDDSLILPLRADFTVLEEAVYDRDFAASATGIIGTAQTGDSFAYLGTNLGALGANATEAGGTGDHLTAINLPDQTMNITGDITGNLSGSVGSVTGAVGSVTAGVTLANGAITNASLAGNMEIVFETDFATNYDATNDVWKANATHFAGTAYATALAAEVDAVWDEALSGHTTADTAGSDLAAAKDNGDYPGDFVHLSSAGSAGTTVGVNGTARNPVDTVTDARTIAAARSRLSLKGSPGAAFTVSTGSLANYTIDTNGGAWTIDSAVSLAGTRLYSSGQRANLYGTALAPVTTGAGTVIQNLYVSGVTATSPQLTMINCGIAGTMTDSTGGPSATDRPILENCYNFEADGSAVLFNLASGGHWHLLGWYGDAQIANMTGATQEFYCNGWGKLTIAASCTAGTVKHTSHVEVVDTNGDPYVGAVTTELISVEADIADIPRVLSSGTAQSATSNTIVLAASTAFGDDILNGAVIKIMSGTGAGQHRVISDYVGSTDTATVEPNWKTTPSSDSVYEIVVGSANLVTGSNNSLTQQLSFTTGGQIQADVKSWDGAGVEPSALAGVPSVNVKYIGGSSTAGTNAATCFTGTITTFDALDTAQDVEHDATQAAIAALNDLDAAGVRTAVGLASANLDTQLGDLPTVAEFEARTLIAASYATAANQTTLATAIADVPTAIENADALLVRNVSNVEATAGEHTLCTVILAGLESSISGTTMTIFRTDGTTPHATKTLTKTAGDDPIRSIS